MSASVNNESDSMLMLAYSSGDAAAFELLFNRHKRSVYHFFYIGSCGHESVANELFQDVWMQVVRWRGRFTARMKFSEWLHHLCWARLEEHLTLHPNLEPLCVSRADQACTQAGNGAEQDGEQISAAAAIAIQKTQTDTQQLLNHFVKLSSHQREIVLLRYCLGMTLQEISVFLDVARNAVQRVHRDAVQSLRCGLAEAG